MPLARLVAIETTLVSFSILLVLDRVAPWALFILSVAIGLEVSRRVRDHDESVARWTLRIAGVGFLASILVAGSTRSFRAIREARAVSSLAAAPEGAPNILLLILDTVRASSLELYGGAAQNTPNLMRRAATGILFENAYSTASWTLPSHASMFTGQYASRTGADWKVPLDARYPTLAEELQRRGWATGGFVGNTVAAWYRTGLSRGFLHYYDTPYTVQEALLETTLTQSKSFVSALIEWQTNGWLRGAIQRQFPFTMAAHGNYVYRDLISAEEVADRFLAWQGALPKGRPFFAFLNIFDAHAPYLPPQSYRAKFGAHNTDRERYLGAIAYEDATIESLLHELERRGALRNTIVVITADHGELFGEHKLVGHGNALYREQLRVPLLVLNAPGVSSPSRIRAPVSLRDLAATIMALAGVGDSHPLGGVPLLQVLNSCAERCADVSPAIAELSRGINVDPQSFAGRADQKSVVNDSLQVIASSEETLLAFDLRRDSLQLNDDALCGESEERGEAARTLLIRTLLEGGIVWDSVPASAACR